MKWLVKTSALWLVLVLVSPAAAGGLVRAAVADAAKVPGTFTVVLVGGTFAADAERIAIFDLEGDRYHFHPVTSSYRVREIKGLKAPAALAAAVNLFSSHCAYNGYRVKSLKLTDGTLVGYELTPDYPPALCEWGNVVTVSYSVGADGEIKVYTWLQLPVEDDGFYDNDDLEK